MTSNKNLEKINEKKAGMEKSKETRQDEYDILMI